MTGPLSERPPGIFLIGRRTKGDFGMFSQERENHAKGYHAPRDHVEGFAAEWKGVPSLGWGNRGGVDRTGLASTATLLP